MTYCIGTNTSTIKTCLSKDKALSAIERLWNDEILENLAFLTKDQNGTLAHSYVFNKEERVFLEIDDILDEVYDYSFEADDYPEFCAEAVLVKEDGTVEVFYCSEGGGCKYQELTDYLCFAIQRCYGVGNHYSRRSECDHPGGRDILISNVYNDGHCEVVYTSN